jgi:nucleoid DNA-binding protein
MVTGDDFRLPTLPMLKSELIQRISSQNPHLYQRDVEKVVDAILDKITKALADGDRVEVRGFGVFSTKLREARPQSSYWSCRFGRTESHALLQGWKRNAKAT